MVGISFCSVVCLLKNIEEKYSIDFPGSKGTFGNESQGILKVIELRIEGWKVLSNFARIDEEFWTVEDEN